MKTSITVALLIITLLSSVPLLINNAHAQQLTTNVDLVQEGGNNQVFAMYEQGLFVTVSNEAHTFNGYDASYLQWISSDSVVTNDDWSFARIQPFVGGCDTVNNPCDPQGGSGLELFGDITIASEPNWSGQAGGLWCGVTDCFTWFISSNSSYPNQLQRWTLDGGNFVLSGYANSTGSGDIQPVIGGIDTNTGGIGGITVYTVKAEHTIVKYGGTSLMQVVNSFDLNAGSSLLRYIHVCHTLMPFCNESEYAVLTDFNSVTDEFRLFDLDNTLQCERSISDTNEHRGLVYDHINDYWLATSNNAGQITAYEGDACTVVNQSVGHDTSVNTLVLDGNIENAWYVYHGSNAGTLTLTRYNISATNIDVPFDFDNSVGNEISGWVTGNGLNIPYMMAIDPISNTMMLTGSDAKTRILYLSEFTDSEEGGGGGGTGGIDCDLPANENLLICRLGQDGTISGSAGAFVIGSVSDNTGLLGLGCSIGVVDCIADDNVQTNGLGLLIFIASIFVVVGMFFYTMGKDIVHIPTFIWVIIIIALSAFFTISGIIDPVFLIVSVIALIALASPKIVGMLKTGSTFGSGSTA